MDSLGGRALFARHADFPAPTCALAPLRLTPPNSPYFFSFPTPAQAMESLGGRPLRSPHRPPRPYLRSSLAPPAPPGPFSRLSSPLPHPRTGHGVVRRPRPLRAPRRLPRPCSPPNPARPPLRDPPFQLFCQQP
jgi:hypothetical protein